MKKSIVLFLSGVMIILIVSSFNESRRRAGVAGYVGSPDEESCLSCHDYAGGTTKISSVPAMENGQYVPGQLYNMTVTVTGGANLFGFAFEALNNFTNEDAGLLNADNSTDAQIKIALNGRTNAVHFNGASPNSHSFSFDWTAPDTGSVSFYAAGVVANNDIEPVGDSVSFQVLSLTPKTTSIKEKTLLVNKVNVYPNPTTENVTVNYQLKQAEQVNISIYSTNGQLITTLLSEKQATGEHQSTFKISDNIAKGYYLLKIKVREEMISQKLLVD